MTVERLLTELVRVGVCGEPLSDTLRDAISPDVLPALYRLSKHHDLAHVVGTVLDESQLLSGDGEVRAKFQKQQMMAIYRAQQMSGALQEICETLEAAKIPFLPLKGAVIRNRYPEPWMRTSCDVDVLVREEDLDATVEVLQKERGYTLKGPRNYHDVSLFSPTGVHLELHFHIRENMQNIDRLLSRVWEFAYPIAADSCQYCLTNEYFAFYLLAHMAYHFLTGGCGVRPFLDLWIWEQRVGYENTVLVSMCKECNLEAFFDAVKRVCDVWFSGAEEDPLSAKIREFILRGGVYGSVENKVSVQQHKTGGKWKYLWSRLFLPYDTLKYYYPILQKHKWLLPICEVRRWFRLILKRSAKRSLSEINATQAISQTQAEASAHLLNELGL